MPRSKVVKSEFFLALLFFGIFLIVGLRIYEDYGVSWDEPIQREIGLVNVDYMNGSNKMLLIYPDRFYGPIYEILLIGIEKVFQPATKRDIFLLRHLFTFLTFYLGCVFFYILSKRVIKIPLLAIACTIALVLSPRIFENSFYNSKDIPSLVIFIICFSLLFRYIDNKKSFQLILLAFFSAIAITIRLSGLIIPALVVFTILWDNFYRPGGWKRKIFLTLVQTTQFLSIFVIFTIAIWPILWSDPVENFYSAIKLMSRYKWDGNVLFMGNRYSATELPSLYSIIWISITTPFLYICLFVIGIFQLFAEKTFFLTRDKNKGQLKRILLLAWFLGPILLVIFLNSALYDSWRHLFFIYPAFVLIAFYGLESLLIRLKNKFGGNGLYSKILITALGVSFIFTAYFMVKAHPYQQIYFNFLAGGNLEKIGKQYDMDYWGLSYREALEYISQIDPDPYIPYSFETAPGGYNFVLQEKDQKRLVPVLNKSEAKYYITNFRYESSTPYDNEIFSVQYDGLKLVSVFKIK